MENDPQNTPVEGGPVEGQIENTETPAPSEETVDPTTQRLTELEQHEKELQRRLTQQGRELARFRDQTAQNPQPATQTTSPEEWFNDPDGNTQRAINAAMEASERRQEDRRQAEHELERRAQDRGMTAEQMRSEYGNLMAASSDPDVMVDLLARIHESRNTSAKIQDATQAVKDSTIRNARAVVAEGGSSATPDAGPMTEEQFRALTVGQQEEYIKRYIGVGEWKD